ncbi:trimeric intracellular cation channel type B [Dermochelys coriacea]|uniref:trimeric intracellular cation channel type B n=1 Tax=Dermochelys coriacea TaxID=27794 RepID=UPI001CA88872|nr:trimeric intracellular cation channel type B [Dermochelys coriacea]
MPAMLKEEMLWAKFQQMQWIESISKSIPSCGSTGAEELAVLILAPFKIRSSDLPWQDLKGQESRPPRWSHPLSALPSPRPPAVGGGARAGAGPGRREGVAAAMELGPVALRFSRLPMFPFFDAAHYLASVMALKEQRGAVEVSRQSPIACWFSAMLYCFGGSVLSSLMLAEPPVGFLANGTNIFLASSVWYLVFFCPHDMVYRCFSFLPLRLMVAGMKEVTRTWKITAGIAHANSHYKNAWLIMVAVGWARGAGGGLISNFEQLVRGVWKPESNELLKMSYPVKVTLVGAVLFTLQHAQNLPIARHNLMFLYTTFLVVTKVTMMLTQSAVSPFAPFESVLGRMLFGWQQTPSKVKGEARLSSNGTSSVCDRSAGEASESIKKRQAKKTE